MLHSDSTYSLSQLCKSFGVVSYFGSSDGGKGDVVVVAVILPAVVISPFEPFSQTNFNAISIWSAPNIFQDNMYNNFVYVAVVVVDASSTQGWFIQFAKSNGKLEQCHANYIISCRKRSAVSCIRNSEKCLQKANMSHGLDIWNELTFISQHVDLPQVRFISFLMLRLFAFTSIKVSSDLCVTLCGKCCTKHGC